MSEQSLPDWLVPPAIDPVQHLLGSDCIIRKTEHAGRAVFATRDLKADTKLLVVSKPFASTVFDDFKKELCGTCFTYDGKRLKVKIPTHDGKRKLRWFCSEQCKDLWLLESGPEGVEATEIAEELVHRSSRAKPSQNDRSDESNRRGEASLAWVRQSWDDAELQANHIKELRKMADAAASAKTRAKILRQAAEGVAALSRDQDDGDIIRFLADAVVRRFQSHCMQETQQTEDLWLAAMALAPSLQPYKSGTQSTPGKAALASHIRIYLHFCLSFPIKLLPFVTPSTIVGAISRDAGNSFGFWSSDFELDDNAYRDGYLLGYALYPQASFFNHSCAPTVKKTRKGRSWEFYALRDIKAGEELCISYIGGDEKLTLSERQAKLKKGWYFSCQCTKCLSEMSGNEVRVVLCGPGRV